MLNGSKLKAADKNLNVLFVSHDAHPNGAQNLLLALTRWLKERELVNARFVLLGPGSLEEEFLRVGPILKFDADRQSKSSLDVKLRLLRSFSGDELSAVYINSAASGHIIELTRHLKVPQIAHVHELQKSIDRWVGAERMSALKEYAQMFIAASGPVADNLHQHYGISRQRLRVVDAFIKCTGIRTISEAEKLSSKRALGLRPEAKLVIGCGTTDWRKGPDLFVQVAKAVCQKSHVPIEFVWLGGETQIGEISELRKAASSNGLADKVRFIGEVPTPVPFMIASDVFLLPSREDPFPLVCLEAADCGIPIICFAEAGGMPDFVGSGCGSVVSYLDIKEMADELISFLSDEGKTRRLGEQAREMVRKKCDVSVKGHDIYEILRDVVLQTSNGDGHSHATFELKTTAVNWSQ